MKFLKLNPVICLIVLCLSVQGIAAQTLSRSALANRFIASLNDDQKKKLVYDFDGDERYNWHFVPKNDRKGIMIHELSQDQKKAAFTLLKVYLSESGYQKSQAIIKLEILLKQLENRKDDDHYRDPERYAFIIFGKPSNNNAWGWRFEGHHISFNFSTYKDKVTASTPNFLGSNPAIVLSGPQKGLQILKNETETGFLLIGSLNPQQLKKAVFAVEAPGDIVTSNSRKATIEQVRGIAYNELDKKQQALFIQLVSIYVNRYTKNFADDMMEEIRQAGLDKLHFAWAGIPQQTTGKPNYYCIQGPTLIIEYDNTQNNANHVHTVVRDLNHDFGGDELLKHYREDH